MRRARRQFLAVLAVTVGAKAALAWAFPVIGDEAYLFTWAREPAWGYYDHPPVAAWLLYPVFALGLEEHPLALRLPSVLLHAVIALVAVGLLRASGHGRGASAERAYLSGTLLLLVPIHVLGVLMLTDVPLVLFCFLSGAALCRAEGGPSGTRGRVRPGRTGGRERALDRLDDDRTVRRGPVRQGRTLRDRLHAAAGGGLGWYAAAGAFLGLALASKYLAGLLAVAYAAWLATVERTPRRRRGFALLVLCALPPVVVHLAWNATHCWSTVLFNLYSRHAGEGENYSVARNLLVYAGTHLYLLGPPLLLALVRRRRRLAAAFRDPALRPAALGFFVPVGLLGVAAATLLFGAYWVLPFYPFLFLLLPRVLTRRDLRSGIAWMAVFTGVQTAALAVAVALPLRSWQGAGFYDSLVTMERTGEVLERLAPLRPEGARLAAPGYSLASLLAWESGEPVAVFGPGSHYARQDDLWTDYRALSGDDVVLLSKDPVAPEAFDPYFRRVERRVVEVEGFGLHVAVGRTFELPRYRREILEEVRRRYYRTPEWLPIAGCPFCERYFGAPECGPG
ncbi:MAG: glycosyltransferase family 39 protein [Thermoanaerobaculia bacterium]